MCSQPQPYKSCWFGGWQEGVVAAPESWSAGYQRNSYKVREAWITSACACSTHDAFADYTARGQNKARESEQKTNAVFFWGSYEVYMY